MTTFHCDNLCGNACCEPLRWALADSDPLNNAERERKRVYQIGGPIDFSRCIASPKQLAATAALYPTIIAELMASALRARGFWTRTELSHDGAYVPELRKVVQTVAHYLVFADYEANCEEHELSCCIPDICEHNVINVYDGSLSEWRAKLLAIMQLPLPNTCDKCGATVECSPFFPSGYDYYCKTHGLTNVAMSTFKIREECETIIRGTP